MEQFKEKIEALVDKYYKDVEFRVMLTCPKTIGSNFVFKDKVPPELRSMVVYKIKCKGCDATYIGKTVRCLIRSKREHSKGTGSGENISSWFKHSITTGHNIDYDDSEFGQSGHSQESTTERDVTHPKRKTTIKRTEGLFFVHLDTGQEQSILDGSLSVMVASVKLFMLRLLLINILFIISCSF